MSKLHYHTPSQRITHDYEWIIEHYYFTWLEHCRERQLNDAVRIAKKLYTDLHDSVRIRASDHDGVVWSIKHR